MTEMYTLNALAMYRHSYRWFIYAKGIAAMQARGPIPARGA